MQPQGAAPDQLKQAIAEVTPALIVDAVDELLLLQRGKDLKYSLSDEQFKNIVDQIRKENKLEDDQAFQNALKQEGMTTLTGIVNRELASTSSGTLRWRFRRRPTARTSS